jgi:hypothetical protein
MDLGDLGASSPMDLDGPDPAMPPAPGSKGKRRKTNKRGHNSRHNAKKRREREGTNESS